MPSISIVIPTYRRPEMLAELTQALIPQLAAGDAEALVVDNCPDGSARALIEARIAQMPAFRYLHEPRAGVVHARNCGVAAAQGRHILFLDDDEVPGDTWLAAFARQAAAGVVVSFGRILPRYETAPDADLKDLLDRLFSRDYPHADTGDDISAHFAELGTGNALFEVASCFAEATPFDVRFNASGGEDIFLIKGLMERGVPLAWCPGGLVEELVPTPRMQASYLAERRFAQGQQRCQFLATSPRLADRVKVPVWMGVGAAQVGLNGARALMARFRGQTTTAHQIQIQGGLGKLLWWREVRNHYALSDAG